MQFREPWSPDSPPRCSKRCRGRTWTRKPSNCSPSCLCIWAASLSCIVGRDRRRLWRVIRNKLWNKNSYFLKKKVHLVGRGSGPIQTHHNQLSTNAPQFFHIDWIFFYLCGIAVPHLPFLSLNRPLACLLSTLWIQYHNHFWLHCS